MCSSDGILIVWTSRSVRCTVRTVTETPPYLVCWIAVSSSRSSNASPAPSGGDPSGRPCTRVEPSRRSVPDGIRRSQRPLVPGAVRAATVCPPLLEAQSPRGADTRRGSGVTRHGAGADPSRRRAPAVTCIDSCSVNRDVGGGTEQASRCTHGGTPPRNSASDARRRTRSASSAAGSAGSTRSSVATSSDIAGPRRTVTMRSSAVRSRASAAAGRRPVWGSSALNPVPNRPTRSVSMRALRALRAVRR